MSAAAEQMELIADFPLERVSRRSLLQELASAYEQHGSLIPQNMIPRLLGVSRERVRQLIHERKLVVVRVDDRNFIPWDSFKYFCAEERNKGGRPLKIPASLVRTADRVNRLVKKTA